MAAAEIIKIAQEAFKVINNEDVKKVTKQIVEMLSNSHGVTKEEYDAMVKKLQDETEQRREALKQQHLLDVVEATTRQDAYREGVLNKIKKLAKDTKPGENLELDNLVYGDSRFFKRPKTGKGMKSDEQVLKNGATGKYVTAKYKKNKINDQLGRSGKTYQKFVISKK